MNSSKQHRLCVVIVNYNVKYFLEQCLNSVLLACQNISAEIFVVDNLSVDGSVAMVKEKFPSVKLIENKKNVGFSRANNQAIRESNSEYVLLLNPDTVVEEDSFVKILQFMDENPDAGGLGVKMVDGKGKFLPESKRALPSPAVAFWKIFGFSQIFPKSKIFGRYHLGHLSKDENHSVEILSGAFMLMRQETLDKVGLLDESFFMYGEDIDLSYRIIKAGYKNYYFADTTIIHYKGESTKKSSVNYVMVFYKAMVIFAQKHFSSKNARFFSFLIYTAIYLRAGMAILSRFVKRLALPVLDSVFTIGGMILLTRHWETAGIHFPNFVKSLAIPIYGLIWLLAAYIQGLYDSKFKFKPILTGLFQGTIVILLVYALLPKDFQFSRLYIFVSLAWIILYLIISRIYLHYLIGKRFSLKQSAEKEFLVIGTDQEYERVSNLLRQTFGLKGEIFHVQTSLRDETETFEQIKTSIEVNKIKEVIFCAKDLSSRTIIQWMTNLPFNYLDYKIAQPETEFLIGSNSIDSAGDLYLLNANKIEEPKNVRLKRMLDIAVSSFALIMSPIFIWFYAEKANYFLNLFRIWVGKYSLIGFDLEIIENKNIFPRIKKGIISPCENHLTASINQKAKINLLYARDYSIFYDLKLLKNCWGKLDKAC